MIQVNHDDQGPYYIMKGDNNLPEDPDPIRLDQIERVVVAVIYGGDLLRGDKTKIKRCDLCGSKDVKGARYARKELRRQNTWTSKF